MLAPAGRPSEKEETKRLFSSSVCRRRPRCLCRRRPPPPSPPSPPPPPPPLLPPPSLPHPSLPQPSLTHSFAHAFSPASFFQQVHTGRAREKRLEQSLKVLQNDLSLERARVAELHARVIGRGPSTPQLNLSRSCH